MTRLGMRKFRLAERDRGIDCPAGEAENVAEQRNQAEFAQGTEVALLEDGDCSDVPVDRELEQDVLGQKAVMPTPALQRDLEIGSGNGSTAEHAIGAPGQPAREPAERLVVELKHGVARQGLELGSRDPPVRRSDQVRRHLAPG
jgi:hypothetical protein